MYSKLTECSSIRDGRMQQFLQSLIPTQILLRVLLWMLKLMFREALKKAGPDIIGGTPCHNERQAFSEVRLRAFFVAHISPPSSPFRPYIQRLCQIVSQLIIPLLEERYMCCKECPCKPKSSWMIKGDERIMLCGTLESYPMEFCNLDVDFWFHNE